MLARFRAAGLIWPTLLVAAALAVLVGLGTWQLQRKAWKEGLVRTIETRAAAPPLRQEQALALHCSMVDDGLDKSCEYRRVRLRGTFDHVGERHVFAGVQGPAGRGALGYWVFTPFRISAPDQSSGVDLPQAVFVNRGFVPEALKAPTARTQGQIEGETEIVAQVRTRQVRGWFDGENNAGKNIYYVRDPKELGRPYPEPKPNAPLFQSGWFYIEVVEGAPPGGYPMPLAGHIDLPNRHLEYVLTWYGLALTLIGVYVAFARSRLRSARAAVG